MVDGEFEGVPEPGVLRLVTVGGECLVSCGASLVYRFEAGDLGMRNLAIVSLTDGRHRVDAVAGVFGLTATYVSMLRGRARREGSAGLVRRQGRPRKLSERQAAKVVAWKAAGSTQQQMADRAGVARSVIGEVLARAERATASVVATQESFPEVPEAGAAGSSPEAVNAEAGGGDADGEVCDVGRSGVVDCGSGNVGGAGSRAGSSRVATGTARSGYAGAMLLYPYLQLVGAETIFATLTGGPARRYDDLAVLTAATVGFALGVSTVEGAKHLHRADAGAALGLSVSPEMATLRSRLSALADGCDPLLLQRAFAAGMIAGDPAGDTVYFVDDHFVPYSGAAPVAKGWNTKRRHAQPGRDDTFLCDARGRAVIFNSGEPTSLSSNLPGVLAQLRAVVGPDAKILLGFDRGGAYPSAFAACRAENADWVTYRRAPLVEAAVAPRRSWTTRDGRRVTVMLADETVELKGYGSCRQLTLFEHGKAVLQVLTSDTTATGASLLFWLRARWRIENLFKYAAAHNGIDTLADYTMDIVVDDRNVDNPERIAGRANLAAAETEHADAERALARLLAGDATIAEMNADLPAAHRRIATATADLTQAKTALRLIPAKIPVTDLDPDAKRARPPIERRGLQMVLRLLAFNAEAWLAEHLNAYLADPDEYRSITRNLLHLGGTVNYTTTTITVTLNRPDSPRVARSLQHLTQELNNNPTPNRLPGDRRPLTYQLAAA